VKLAASSGTQPFSTHTEPPLQLPPFERGTHVPSTQTSFGPPQSFVILQAFAAWSQIPFDGSHLYEAEHSPSVEHALMHLPPTHLSEVAHWP
jgi:hypothetical protein